MIDYLTHDMPACQCLACGAEFNAASNFNNVVPKPGHVTLCLRCGHIMAFTDDLTVRELNDYEMDQVARHPKVIRMQRVRTGYVAELSNGDRGG